MAVSMVFFANTSIRFGCLFGFVAEVFKCNDSSPPEGFCLICGGIACSSSCSCNTTKISFPAKQCYKEDSITAACNFGICLYACVCLWIASKKTALVLCNSEYISMYACDCVEWEREGERKREKTST